MKKCNILLILTTVLVLFGFSLAEAVSNAGALYLRVAPGARPGGMGEAFVSIADDATATYWNPAGLGNAPISGMLKTYNLPYDMGKITAVALLQKRNDEAEIWAIAGGEVVRFDGKSWVTGKDYYPPSDKSLEDLLRSIITIGTNVDISPMIAKVVAANCPVISDEVDAFVSKVSESIPADYQEMELLDKGLQGLKTGFTKGLLNAELFYNLRDKLNKGLKDGDLVSEELDRITFSLEQAVFRYLPSRVTIPFGASVNGTPRALIAVNGYLWVATDNGLFRRSGTTWANFSGIDKIPSDNVLSLATNGEEILIGTDRGIAKYARGEFSSWSGSTSPASDSASSDSSAQGLSESNWLNGQVTALVFASTTIAYAVIDGQLCQFDGVSWSRGYKYTVRIDDNLESLVERAGIYHTATERKVLSENILALNNVDSNGESDWLVEGNEILLPLSPPLRSGVMAMMIDVSNILWVGTGSGLLSFEDGAWVRHGYDEFVVPQPSGEGEAVYYTAEYIARDYFPGGDSAMVAMLAANIDSYNELSGHPAEPGRTIYVYNENVGSAIYSVGVSIGDLHVGTEHGLERLTLEGWQAVEMENLDSRIVLGTYDHEGGALYIGSNGVTQETPGMNQIILMHVNWLPTLGLDMYYDFGSFVHHVRGLGTFGLNFIYLNYGEVEFIDENNNSLGTFFPYEMAVTTSFGTSLTNKLKVGINGKFIHSRLSDVGVGKEKGSGITSTFAVDLGLLYKITDRVQFGTAISNLGPNISYIDQAQSDPLPRNLAIGISAKVWDTQYNSLLIQAELNKILVELNGGNVHELKTAIRHIGAEYWYSSFMALRAGYKYDKEGSVKHLTFGAGLQLKAFMVDFAYVPSSDESPLANTLRMSLTISF